MNQPPTQPSQSPPPPAQGSANQPDRCEQPPKTNTCSRRDLLSAAALAAAGAVLSSHHGPAANAQPPTAANPPTATRPVRTDAQRPRAIILLISDGMSLGTLTMAEQLAQLTRNRSTRWADLLRNPNAINILLATDSADSPVTDSAAAATAIASGHRARNGTINLLPDGRPLTPITALLHRQGHRIGLVSTTRITHATPAGFASSVNNRNLEDSIAEQYLKLGVDLLLGGGSVHFDPAARSDQRDLLADYRQANYAILTSAAQLADLKPSARALGLFDTSHLPYTIDQLADPAAHATMPTLAQLTAAALACLHQHDGGYLLMVEGGRVDHAAHNNDAAGILHDQLAFDDALAVALDHAERTADTLVLTTTDHANANPGLNGMGSGYRRSGAAFERLARVKHSFDWVIQRITDAGGPTETTLNSLRCILHRATALELPDAELLTFKKALNKLPTGEIHVQHENPPGIYGQILANHLGIGFCGTSHTSDFAPLTAIGPGAHALRDARHLADLQPRIASLLGIDPNDNLS